MKLYLLFGTLVTLFSCQLAAAQTSQPVKRDVLPADSLKDGWEAIDERIVFLTVRLSSVETSLQAVNKSIKLTGYEQKVTAEKVEGFQKGNERMDRNGGAPVGWSEFYGRTAEKFFYHPTDPNSSYHTDTALGQQHPDSDQSTHEGAPSRQGLPVHQRPPQFDYIYKANKDAARRAEQQAAALGNKIGPLLTRRSQLEAEQSGLWCTIVFRAVSSREISSKPLYRFDLKASGSDETARQRLEAARAACDFVRSVDLLIGQAQDDVGKNQGAVFLQLQRAVSDVRHDFEHRLAVQQTLLVDMGNSGSRLGRTVAAVKRLDVVMRNMQEAYALADEGEKSGDDQRKDTFRGLLQETLISGAETVLTIDQCVANLADEWKVMPATDTPAPAPKVAAFVVPKALDSDQEKINTPPESLSRTPQSNAESPAGPDLRSTPAPTPKPAPVVSPAAGPKRADLAELKARAQQRMAQDLKKYSREDLNQAEALYQVANKGLGNPEARASLGKMIDKYPDINRTGCAILYLAQMTKGEDQEKLLNLAIEKYGDCFYGDGVQVASFARFTLALNQRTAGKAENASALFEEIKNSYSDAIDHRGELLVKQIPNDVRAPALKPVAGTRRH